MVGPIGPSTVRSIKRLVRFSRKPLSSVAPRSEFAVWRQVAASFVPRLGLSLRELSKFHDISAFPIARTFTTEYGDFPLQRAFWTRQRRCSKQRSETLCLPSRS